MKKMIGGVIFVGYLVLVALFLQVPEARFRMDFLNVGQGDAILIQTPQNHQILIDGGPGNGVLSELTAVLPFFDKSLDLLVVSHPHEDHIAGLVEVLRRYEVEAVLITGVAYKNAAYEEFLRLANEGGSEIFFAEADVDFGFGEVLFDVLYPFESIVGRNFENVNNSSVVMKATYKDVSVLLTGDLELEGESELLERDVDLSANILKAGHHGSKTSSSFEFLQRVRPKIVVIQCGVENKFGHPHIETLRNFHRIGVEKIYRNDLDGRVELEF